jgi:fatty acid-binding protein DegV
VGASIPARSRKGAIEGLYKEFLKHIDPRLPLHVTVLHNAALDEAQELADRLQRERSPQEMFISIVSPVLGVHTGPCALALCGYSGE